MMMETNFLWALINLVKEITESMKTCVMKIYSSLNPMRHLLFPFKENESSIV